MSDNDGSLVGVCKVEEKQKTSRWDNCILLSDDEAYNIYTYLEILSPSKNGDIATPCYMLFKKYLEDIDFIEILDNDKDIYRAGFSILWRHYKNSEKGK